MPLTQSCAGWKKFCSHPLNFVGRFPSALVRVCQCLLGDYKAIKRTMHNDMEDALVIINNSIEGINNLDSINENMMRRDVILQNRGGFGAGFACDDEYDEEDYQYDDGMLYTDGRARLNARARRPEDAALDYSDRSALTDAELKRLKKREYNAAYKQRLLQRSREAAASGGSRKKSFGGARNGSANRSTPNVHPAVPGHGTAIITSGNISKKSESYLDQHYFNITKMSLNNLRKVYNTTHRHTSSNNRQWIMKMLIKAEDESLRLGKGSMLQKWLGDSTAAPAAPRGGGQGERAGVKKSLFDPMRQRSSPRDEEMKGSVAAGVSGMAGPAGDPDQKRMRNQAGGEAEAVPTDDCDGDLLITSVRPVDDTLERMVMTVGNTQRGAGYAAAHIDTPPSLIVHDRLHVQTCESPTVRTPVSGTHGKAGATFAEGWNNVSPRGLDREASTGAAAMAAAVSDGSLRAAKKARLAQSLMLPPPADDLGQGSPHGRVQVQTPEQQQWQARKQNEILKAPHADRSRRAGLTSQDDDGEHAAVDSGDDEKDDDDWVEQEAQTHGKLTRSSRGVGAGGKTRSSHQPARAAAGAAARTQTKARKGAKGARGGPRKRKVHHPWTSEECHALVDGVSRCGGGKWAEIKKLDAGALASRSAVDLKDKWRNLTKVTSNVLDPEKTGTATGRGKDVPVELLRRVQEILGAHASPA